MNTITLKIKCIGFDLYSTLIDTTNYNRDDITEFIFPFIKNLGYKGSIKHYKNTIEEIHGKWEEYREKSQIEVSSNVWWKEILEKLGVTYQDKDLAQIFMKWNQKWRTQISLYPGVKELLTKLKKKYKLALISNISDGEIARGDMAMFGVLDMFNIVVLSSDLGIRKPSPKIFEYALDKLNIKKNEMIFIGDSLHDDIQGAKHTGLLMAIHIKRDKAYFFPNYYIEPDKTISNLYELCDTLNSK